MSKTELNMILDIIDSYTSHKKIFNPEALKAKIREIFKEKNNE